MLLPEIMNIWKYISESVLKLIMCWLPLLKIWPDLTSPCNISHHYKLLFKIWQVYTLDKRVQWFPFPHLPVRVHHTFGHKGNFWHLWTFLSFFFEASQQLLRPKIWLPYLLLHKRQAAKLLGDLLNLFSSHVLKPQEIPQNFMGEGGQDKFLYLAQWHLSFESHFLYLKSKSTKIWWLIEIVFPCL